MFKVFSVLACPVFLLVEHESLGSLVNPDVFTASLVVGSLEPSSTVATRFTCDVNSFDLWDVSSSSLVVEASVGDDWALDASHNSLPGVRFA